MMPRNINRFGQWTHVYIHGTSLRVETPDDGGAVPEREHLLRQRSASAKRKLPLQRLMPAFPRRAGLTLAAVTALGLSEAEGSFLSPG